MVHLLGLLAGALTTLAFLPQVIKAYQSQKTDSLSLLMLLVFAAGLGLWIIYGVLLSSFPIIVANCCTLVLLACLIALKIKCG